MPDPNDVEFIKWFATLGVGGVLAGLMVVFYRRDVRQYTDLWKGQSDTLIQIVKENTSSNTKLVTVIEALHRRMDYERDDRDDRARNDRDDREGRR